MLLDLQLAQRGATVTLNLALAVAAGSGMSMLWLRRLASPWAASQRKRMRLASLASLGLALLASAVILWLEAAAMAEVPITEAGGAAWSMATATHFGMAWAIGMAALFFSAGVIALHTERAKPPIWLNLFGLALFAYTRSMVSHAAADGDLNLAMMADWLHLILACMWAGIVIVAGLLGPARSVGEHAADRLDSARYIESLSASATFALAGIVATGLFSAWHNLGSPDALSGNPYGTTLLFKLALVAIAAFLGGANRLLVMPSLLATLRGAGSASATCAQRFALILKVEALVLFGVLILASVLSSTAPPII